jgi:hypothetical protein
MSKLGTNLPDWVQVADVEDATRAISINVRTEDVESGRHPQDGNSCVVAQCALRALGAYEVYVYRCVAYVIFDQGARVQRFAVSQRLKENVIIPLDREDYDGIVPGVYDLLPMPPTKRLGVQAAYQAARKAQRERGELPPVQPKGTQETRRQIRGRIRSARGVS